jgi:hypothetical protein
MIQILPIVALIIAYVLVTFVDTLSIRYNLSPVVHGGLFLFLILVVWIWPAYNAGTYVIQQLTTSTKVQARYWIVDNLPIGSKIAHDYYAAPLDDAAFDVTVRFTLAEEPSLGYYYQEGYDYLVVSSYNYDRYLNQAEYFPKEAGFYETLFGKARLLHVVEPDTFHGGPTIKVYKLPKRKSLPD